MSNNPNILNNQSFLNEAQNLSQSKNTANEMNSDNGLNPNKLRHAKGCSCKKSKCLKKYCECFQAGIPCEKSNCKCHGCKNYVGCEERKNILEHQAKMDAQQQQQFLQQQQLNLSQ